MKVLIVTQYFWPEEFRVNELAWELSLRGHDVEVLTGWPNYPTGSIFKDFKKNRSRFDVYGDISIIRVPIVPRGSTCLTLILNYLSFAIWGGFRALTIRKDKVDVIFCYQPSPPTSVIPAVIASFITKAPLVYWVLDLWPNTPHELGFIKSPVAVSLIRAFTKYLYSRSHFVLGQSKSIASSIRDLGFPLSKVKLLRSWSEAVFEVGSPAEKKIETSKPLIVVSAGNLGFSQDPENVVRAIKMVQNAHPFKVIWQFIGDGRARNFMESELLEEQKDGIVEFLGSFKVEDVPQYYASADAFLISLKDLHIFSQTVPARLQTYMMFGRPILAMLNGESAEIIREAEAGFVVNAGDFAQLAQRVSTLLHLDEKNRSRLADNARSYGMQNFSKASAIEQIESLLKESVSRDERI